MLRRITYRAAATAFVFTGLWFVFGLTLLLTPIPRALGIAGQMFAAWAVLFFVVLGGAGATLCIAAFNGMFPPDVRAPGGVGRPWAASKDLQAAPLPRRPGTAESSRSGSARARGG